jgi:tetraacyldisaccharide 4'-kinase
MQIIYNIAVILLVIIAIPVFIVRSIREKGFTERLKQSFGFLHEEALKPVANKKCIWVHAASVGEIVAASPLIREFKSVYPHRPILISVVTSSGYEMANRIIKDADSIIYFPMDLPWLSSHVVKLIMPSVFLPVETELWPNFLRAARRYKIPVMMVNGRISDKSVKNYRYMRSLLRDMLGSVQKFCMRSEQDAKYIIRLGANPSLVTVTGNTKFDQTYTDVSPKEKRALLSKIGFKESDEILLAGSTHKGEEKCVLDAFYELRQTKPQAKLLIAPREIMRADEIGDLISSYGFTAKKRTELNRVFTSGHDAVILDTIGELGKMYSLGTVVYVGGSLVKHGGHNILEPAAHGKAIVVGSDMANFKDTHELFASRHACMTVQNSAELTKVVLELFNDEKRRCEMEQETLAIIRENVGASKKSAHLLQEMLSDYEERITGKISQMNANIESVQNYLYHLVHSDTHGFFDTIILGFLYGCSLVYSNLVNLKLYLYKTGLLKAYRLPCHVISLGNVTVGGTGKTPTALCLAALIRDMGYRVAVLNRGYRAKWKGDIGVVSDGRRTYMTAAEAGDEAFLMAKNLPGVSVVVGPDRSETGRYAVQKMGAEVVILDDGYQHWRLARDLDIMLVDAINVFGNDHVLPRGTLREPIAHVDRADVCLLTKVDQAPKENCDRIRDVVARYNDHAIVVESIHKPRCFIEIADWYKGSDQILPVETMRGKRVTAVSGIGNPASFEQTIRDIGAIVANSIRFPDHHDYSIIEMQSVMERAAEEGIDAIVITDKDAVKIPAEIIHSGRSFKLYVLSIEISFQKGAEEFTNLLQKSLREKVGR